MEIRQMEQKVLQVCIANNWELLPKDDMMLLTEEVGELAREVRRMENGRQRPDEVDPDREVTLEHMAEEIGDILFPLIKIAAYYGIPLQKAFDMHIKKMGGRTKDALDMLLPNAKMEFVAPVELTDVARSANSGIIAAKEEVLSKLKEGDNNGNK
jgi:NTP pyrophosphatase (non-canonical NTP hydrolase)